MQATHNAIRTAMDPKDFRAKHGRILVRHAGFEVTATTEIFDEDYDPATKTFTMEIGLHYPRRSTSTIISLAVLKTKEGKSVAVQPPSCTLTQEDFDAVIRGEVIDVPTLD